jgi:hypothetical protein
MEQMLLGAADRPVATVAGLVAMACYAAWPSFHSRPAILLAYAGNNIGFVVHYALLDQWTATALNGTMAVQTLLALLFSRAPQLRWVYAALIPVPIVIGAVTWHGLPSVLAATAALLSTLGRMQTREIALRTLLLASMPIWADHDVVVGSLPGLIADLLGIGISAVMLARRLAPGKGGARPRSAG